MLARNHRTRFGELDLVVYDGAALVFVEVKTRRGGSARAVGEPARRASSQGAAMAIAWLTEGRPALRRGAALRRRRVLLDARGELVRLDHLEAAF